MAGFRKSLKAPRAPLLDPALSHGMSPTIYDAERRQRGARRAQKALAHLSLDATHSLTQTNSGKCTPKNWSITAKKKKILKHSNIVLLFIFFFFLVRRMRIFKVQQTPWLFLLGQVPELTDSIFGSVSATSAHVGGRVANTPNQHGNHTGDGPADAWRATTDLEAQLHSKKRWCGLLEKETSLLLIMRRSGWM